MQVQVEADEGTGVRDGRRRLQRAAELRDAGVQRPRRHGQVPEDVVQRQRQGHRKPRVLDGVADALPRRVGGQEEGEAGPVERQRHAVLEAEAVEGRDVVREGVRGHARHHMDHDWEQAGGEVLPHEVLQAHHLVRVLVQGAVAERDVAEGDRLGHERRVRRRDVHHTLDLTDVRRTRPL